MTVSSQDSAGRTAGKARRFGSHLVNITLRHDSTGRAAGTGARLVPHRVSTTLVHDRTPSTTIDAAASAKKFW